MFRLTHCVLVLSVDFSLGATGGEEEDVVAFVGGDSAGEDEGMRLCIGGDEVGDLLVASRSRILVVSRRPPDFFCRGITPCSLYHRRVWVILLRLTL